MLSRTLYREFEVLIHLCTAFRDNPAITFLLCDVCRQKTKLQLLSRPLNRTAIRLIDVMPDEFEVAGQIPAPRRAALRAAVLTPSVVPLPQSQPLVHVVYSEVNLL